MAYVLTPQPQLAADEGMSEPAKLGTLLVLLAVAGGALWLLTSSKPKPRRRTAASVIKTSPWEPEHGRSPEWAEYGG